MTAQTPPPLMNDDNRIVRGLWIDGRLSELERLCIRSFCANGHEFHLYHYGELSNLPKADGFRLMDAADILPHSAIFRRKNGSLAAFSDYWRWELMRQKGGWYVDMDVVCLRPFDFSADIVFGLEESPDTMNSAVMKFPRGHSVAAALADACANVDDIVPWDTPKRKKKKMIRRLSFWRNSRKHIGHGESGGPVGFSLAVKHFGLQKHALPIHTFCPVCCTMVNYFFNSAFAEMGAAEPLLSQSFAVHLYASAIKDNGINPDDKMPDNSIYETLRRRYPEQ